MTQAAPQIPLPVPQPESDFYWEKCKEHELWLRRCIPCDQAFFYPRDMCPFPDCFCPETDWVQSSGRGTLHTFAIVHRAPVPAFRDKVPYITAVVELEEGPRIPHLAGGHRVRRGGDSPGLRPVRDGGGGRL